MILVCGIPSEQAIAMVLEQLYNIGAPHVVFNQRQFASAKLEFKISRGQISGFLQLRGSKLRLEDVQSVYTRMMDFRYLPEIRDEPADSQRRLYCQALHNTIMHWFQIAQARVISRPSILGSNFSKPYQVQLIQEQGFNVPETLITNDPSLVLQFYENHDRVIYKSISSVRSIVQTLKETDLERLDHIRWCPTQFQSYIKGSNVRVHVVGRKTFATIVNTDATDYRYAYQVGGHTNLKAFELPNALAEKCVKLSYALGLEVSGIDLKITPDNQVYCFEVNPSPAFGYYENSTGQPIALAIAQYLADV